jgi:hypothetical protein
VGRILKKSDYRILAIITSLIIVTTILEPGPLRTKLEVDLVLSFVPGLGPVIDTFQLMGSDIDTGSLHYYLGLFKILLEAYFSAVILDWIKSKSRRK